MTYQQIATFKKSLQTEASSDTQPIFSALGDMRRFLIFRFLTLHEGACVSDIATVFDISIPAASQQLKNLEKSGLVRRVRQGQKICYEVKYEDKTVASLVVIVRGV